jgi:Ca-activated chloride channel family protein
MLSGMTVAALLVSAPLGAQGPARFRSGVELVSLTVTVTDARQQFVNDLAAANFSVLEDGVPQTVSFFGATGVPLDLALVVDASASMSGKIEMVKRAASGLVRRLHTGNRASLVEFREVISVSQPLTDDRQAVVSRLDGITPRGTTGLYDALYVTLRELNRDRPDTVRRRAIVVLTDGEDTTSLISFDDVMDLARRSGITIYTITLESPSDRRRFQTAGEFGMKSLADQTGARAFFPVSLREVPTIYESISAELSSQYEIGYTSHNPILDGAWRRVVVQVTDRPGARARSRQGYYAMPGLDALSARLQH